jgi:hypothetical protein
MSRRARNADLEFAEARLEAWHPVFEENSMRSDAETDDHKWVGDRPIPRFVGHVSSLWEDDLNRLLPLWVIDFILGGLREAIGVRRDEQEAIKGSARTFPIGCRR